MSKINNDALIRSFNHHVTQIFHDLKIFIRHIILYIIEDMVDTVTIFWPLFDVTGPNWSNYRAAFKRIMIDRPLRCYRQFRLISYFY